MIKRARNKQMRSTRSGPIATCLRHAGALGLACLLLGACEEKRNAPKPIAEAAASAMPAR